MSFLFGPVPSRRLGRSLGVDLVPNKTCSYDCVYCQLGKTTDKTIQRKEWVPLEEVVAELKEKLATKPDYITLSGSGEPTLYARLGELISRIKTVTDIPVAVLTNGSLLWDPLVRAELLHADLLVPSLDAGNESMWKVVNRPHDDLSFDQMLQGLIDMRREFQGSYWLEVLIMTEHTADDTEIEDLIRCVKQIMPDRVQLNTVTRPPAEKYALSVSRETLGKIAQQFNPLAEAIADFREIHQQPDFRNDRNAVLNMLQRRPCTVEDISHGLNLHRNEVIKYVEELVAEALIEPTSSEERCYYCSGQKI